MVIFTKNATVADDSSRNWQVSLSPSNIHGRGGFQWSNIRLQKFPLMTSLLHVSLADVLEAQFGATSVS